MTFDDLQFGLRAYGAGKQVRVYFPNGRGASVVIGPHTYGGALGLYELAVLAPNGAIDYSTPITDDVEGNLSEDDVTRLLGQIEALPAPQVAS